MPNSAVQPLGTLTVVNRRNPLPPYNAFRRQYVFPIHRPYPLGNPFHVAQYGREQAIACYRRWLWRQIQQQGRAYAALCEIAERLGQGDVFLVCYCAPLPCHGDIVAAAVQWLLASGGVAMLRCQEERHG